LATDELTLTLGGAGDGCDSHLVSPLKTVHDITHLPHDSGDHDPPELILVCVGRLVPTDLYLVILTCSDDIYLDDDRLVRAAFRGESNVV
jgi:hypothetical protein